MTELSHRIDAPGAALNALERNPVGHPTLLDQPDEVATLIRSFIAAV